MGSDFMIKTQEQVGIIGRHISGTSYLKYVIIGWDIVFGARYLK
jgi:hypothetical protein